MSQKRNLVPGVGRAATVALDGQTGVQVAARATGVAVSRIQLPSREPCSTQPGTREGSAAAVNERPPPIHTHRVHKHAYLSARCVRVGRATSLPPCAAWRACMRGATERKRK
jgi:hypothetical protein